MKFFYVVILAFTLILSNSGSSIQNVHNQNNESHENCQYPSEEDLDKMLSIVFIKNLKIEKEMLRDPNLTATQIDIYRELWDEPNLISDKNCSKSNDNHIGSKSICPHMYEKINRKNRYPFQVLAVKCLCSKCPNGRCIPVYVKNPVLTRGDCNSSGFYDFVGAIENISNSCECISS